MPIAIQTGYKARQETDLDKILKGLSILKTGVEAGADIKQLVKGDPKDALLAEQLKLTQEQAKAAQRQNQGVPTIFELAKSGLKASPLVTGAPPAQGAPGSPLATGAPGRSPLTQIPKGAFVTRGILPGGEEGDLVVEPLKDLNLQAALTDRRYNFRDEQLEKRNENSVHKTVIERLKTDKTLQDQLRQYNNLTGALSIITKADKLTPQQIHEFQQAIRGNLGIKGGSGVGEREATYLDSLGLRADAFTQFLTGDPAEISKDSKLVQHLRDLAKVELENIGARKGDRISALTSGYDESVYSVRPDLKRDLEKAINAIGGQFKGGQAAAASTEDFNPAKAALAELERRRAAKGGH